MALQNTFNGYEEIHPYHEWWFGKQREKKKRKKKQQLGSLRKIATTKICDWLRYLLREKHEWKKKWKNVCSKLKCFPDSSPWKDFKNSNISGKVQKLIFSLNKNKMLKSMWNVRKMLLSIRVPHHVPHKQRMCLSKASRLKFSVTAGCMCHNLPLMNKNVVFQGCYVSVRYIFWKLLCSYLKLNDWSVEPLSYLLLHERLCDPHTLLLFLILPYLGVNLLCAHSFWGSQSGIMHVKWVQSWKTSGSF